MLRNRGLWLVTAISMVIVLVSGCEESEANTKLDEIVNLNSEKLPDGFPKDVPFVDDYEITSKSRVEDGDVLKLKIIYTTQSTSIEKIIQIYTTFKDEFGYETTDEVSKGDFYSLKLTKETDDLSIKAYQDGEMNIVVVLSVTTIRK